MVNLLTNTENADKISVKIQHGTTTIYGIIVGYDKENEVLKISQLNSNSDISTGDKVTTGGLGTLTLRIFLLVKWLPQRIVQTI